jgi:GNAT superfamily N-acetyltransferase
MADASPVAFAALLALTPAGDRVGLFTAAPLSIPADWRLLNERWIEQMVCEEPPVEAPAEGIVELGADDVPAMLALTAATQPGPFGPRTYEMGRYIGIRDGERLVAMAGERLKLEAWTEISAVCTDPQYAGRGYAERLMRVLMAHVAGEGRRPMLHVKNENGAKRLYERLGFRVRREIRLTVLRPSQGTHS